jgi:NAD(P)H-dependent FMN reductase
VLLGSARHGRRSDVVAGLVAEHLRRRSHVAASLLDLAALGLPIMHRRGSEADPPPAGYREFGRALVAADGLVIVTPEYKGGYPGVLKNALDYLDPGIFRRKPIGIVTVSSGALGGVNCLMQLRHVCMSMGGLPIPASLLVSKVEEAFNTGGAPADASLPVRVDKFLDEFLWYAEAIGRQARATGGRGPDGRPSGG